jgi:hypothetical protein
MVKITEVNQIVDFITPFDSFHKVFAIVSVILSLGTNWWHTHTHRLLKIDVLFFGIVDIDPL